jgi:hypothetical protein
VLWNEDSHITNENRIFESSNQNFWEQGCCSGACWLMKPGYLFSERGMKFFPDIIEGMILCVSAVMQIACWKNWAFHVISKNGSFLWIR